jgi:hypothetical protein
MLLERELVDDGAGDAAAEEGEVGLSGALRNVSPSPQCDLRGSTGQQ